LSRCHRDDLAITDDLVLLGTGKWWAADSGLRVLGQA